MPEDSSISSRKTEHIRISLEEDVAGTNITSGFEHYTFVHQALPELDYDRVDTSTEFLGRKISVPFLISSMTGGTDEALEINRNLAIAAEERGWAMGLGSTRAALESPGQAHTFKIRQYAPSIPLFANLGAVQLNYGYGADECRRIVELTEADALVLHLNSLQEVFQNEGDTNFSGLFYKIEELCHRMEVPVGVKEVGWGINGSLAKKLGDAGAAFIDTAGAGGTSWSQVEKFRSSDPIKRAAAEAFAGWGIPAAQCIREAREAGYSGTLISSGGIRNGVEGAKSLALGADLAGIGRAVLKPACDGIEALDYLFKQIELELKIAMFGIGASSIEELKKTQHIRKRQTF
ncbi:type 2 isopentenyl-diphosphate Delta-isomerase [Peribacillus sp. SCS-26]|uniref:type 2 isopentenyl-diphosphate Delta-isomerase n=1 Tax=Paraperibacillus marinus TaxID=3115295 RepID=UPI003905D5FB